jgi:quinol monooxygenase YgiN
MPDKKLTVVAKIRAKAGKEEQVRNALLSLVAPTRAEAGCINYDLHQSVDDKALFLFYENWTGKKDLDDHLAMPYLRDFLGKADELLAEPVEITLWDMISSLEQR